MSILAVSCVTNALLQVCNKNVTPSYYYQNMHKNRPGILAVLISIYTTLLFGSICGCDGTKKIANQDASKAADASRKPDAARDAQTEASTGPVRCIERWPEDPKASPKPSLKDVGDPRVLWKKKLPSDIYSPETVLAGEHLGVVGGDTLWILDRTTGEESGNLPVSGTYRGYAALVADKEETFYYGTSSIRAVKPDGSVRWEKALGDNLASDIEETITSKLQLSPEGVLYFSATDGYLYALRSKDGSTVWKKKVGLDSDGYALSVGWGVGDTLRSDVAYQADTGETNAPITIDGFSGSSFGIIGSYSGLIAFRYDSFGDEYPWRGYFLDKCGKLLWSFPNTSSTSWFPELVGYNDELLVDGDRRNDSAYVYSRSGERLQGPRPIRGAPTSLGADNTIYNIECSGDLSQEATASLAIVAYSWAIKELWSLDLGKVCTSSGTALADDGVLYVTRQLSDGIEVIAVQTASPGLAPTAYPTRDNNNRRTRWLGPL